MGPLNRRQMVKDRVIRTHLLSHAVAVKLDTFAPTKKSVARAYRAARAQSGTSPAALSSIR